MNIVRTMMSVIKRRASVGVGVIWAAGAATCSSAVAQDAAPVRRAALPVIEWSLQPPMSTDRRSDDVPRELHQRDPAVPALTDPLAPTERLRRSRISDVTQLPITAPQDLPSDRSRLVLSLRATPASRTSMVFEQTTSARSANSWLVAQAADEPTTRVGIELRSASAEKRLGFNNVLKMQLSGGSTLLLKPRSSGFAVTWRSEF